MRRLWITRHKAYAACAMKMKVYIEDPENGDIEINGVLCRKLGELRNGQKKHFSIEDDAAKAFVVADKLSRNVYNEFVEIPEGRDDVFLSGKNYLAPFSGNPFRFDDVEDGEVLENRKRVRKNGTVILIVSILTGLLAGAALGGVIGSSLISRGTDTKTAEEKTFAEQGLRITLTDEFETAQVPRYTACYSMGETAVFLLREDFSLMEGFAELPLDAYGAMVLANNHFDQSVTLKEEDGMTVFSYDDGTFYYYCVLLKGPDAFWMVQFTTSAEEPEAWVPLFREWAKTVTFSL